MNIDIQVPDSTLVATNRGIVRLDSLIKESNPFYAWATEWQDLSHNYLGTSFHPSFKEAKSFIEQRIQSQPIRTPKLVEISESIDLVLQERGFYCCRLNSLSEAKTHIAQLDS